MTLTLVQLRRGFGPVEASIIDPPDSVDAPAITAAVAGDDIIVSITGDSGATHTVLYKTAGATAWTTGPTRVGNGDVTLSSPGVGVYDLVAYSTLAGVHSPPGNPVTVTLSDPAAEADDDTIDGCGGGAMTAAAVQAATDQLWAFGETILYHRPGAAARKLCAIVTRSGPAELMGLPSGRAERLLISVLNSDDGGIAAAALDTGGDFVTVAARIGDLPRKRRVVRVQEQDPVMLTLEVQ